MAKKKRSLSKIPKQWVSKKILRILLDDFALFGSVPFYVLVTMFAYFIGNKELFLRMVYTFLIGFVVVIAIKKVHYKDRPQKEEFNIFMEKVIASSFPSTHSLIITTITILLYLAYHSLWVLVTFGILSILVYTQRYITKKHFFIDIVGGIVLSVIIIVFVIKVL